MCTNAADSSIALHKYVIQWDGTLVRCEHTLSHGASRRQLQPAQDRTYLSHCSFINLCASFVAYIYPSIIVVALYSTGVSVGLDWSSVCNADSAADEDCHKAT